MDTNMDNKEHLLQGEQWFDLLPAEKKLIGYSLGMGIALLVIMFFLTRTV
ncbi:hypothetical protein V3F56_05265 [Moorellaceae bacterium AZ2]